MSERNVQSEHFLRLLEAARARGRQRVVAIWPHEDNLLAALRRATAVGFTAITLIGQHAAISACLDDEGWLHESAYIRLEEVDGPEAAVHRAVALARNKQADLVMNGMVSPEFLFRAALDKSNGLYIGRRLTAVSVIDAPRLGRPILVADSGLSIKPTLEEKVAIIENAVTVAHALGLKLPRVALLAATEMVNPKSSASLEAAQLSKMVQRGQIKGCLIDGPLALDNAVSPEAATVKGIRSEVAGYADILIGPDLETANILVRAVTHLVSTITATVVVGGACPLAVPSRSDSYLSKLASLALAACLAT